MALWFKENILNFVHCIWIPLSTSLPALKTPCIKKTNLHDKEDLYFASESLAHLFRHQFWWDRSPLCSEMFSVLMATQRSVQSQNPSTLSNQFWLHEMPHALPNWKKNKYNSHFVLILPHISVVFKQETNTVK